MALSDLSLRCVPGQGADRGFLVGGVGAGKSVLEEMLGRDYVTRYPKARRLIPDTKPRFRAQYTAQGMPAKRLYKQWDHGQPVAGSVLVSDPDDLDLAWAMGARTAIVQRSDKETFKEAIPRMLEVIQAFFFQARASRPSLVQFDETMDWFNSNGSPRGGNDIVVQTARAGRERGLAGLYASQRTKGIPPTLMEEMNRLYLLRLDFKADVKRLPEMGAPVTEEDVPRVNHEFRYWYKTGAYDHLYGPYKLAL